MLEIKNDLVEAHVGPQGDPGRLHQGRDLRHAQRLISEGTIAFLTPLAGIRVVCDDEYFGVSMMNLVGMEYYSNLVGMFSLE
jgi:hypothetical protein